MSFCSLRQLVNQIKMNSTKRKLLLSFVLILMWGVIIYGIEWSLFHFALKQCSWPYLITGNGERQGDQKAKPVRAMIMSDTHLLSRNSSTWMDKFNTDWQMYIAFKTALALHEPEIIFVLGDLTDEGLYLTDAQFEEYIQHFCNVFPIPKDVDMYLIAGNYDIGFHYEVTNHLHSRFVQGFKSPDVRLVTVRGNNFVLVNSVLFEVTHSCSFCDEAKTKLESVAKKLKCEAFGIACGTEGDYHANYSKPILIQHYPLYRESDKECREPDQAPNSRKFNRFNESLDCHSKNISDWLLKELNPRLVFSGHTHDGCTTPLTNKQGVEFTLPSFNWKHKSNPSYGLLVLSPEHYAFVRCMFPTRVSVILQYIMFSAFLTMALFAIFCTRRIRGKAALLNI